MPIFFQQNVHSQKTLFFSYPYLVKKQQFSKKHGALISSFFKFFMKNPLLSYPHLVKKRVKTRPYNGPQKSIGCHFFPIFHVNTTVLMPIFCKKPTFAKKHTTLIPIFCREKHPSFQKYGASCHLHSIFNKKPLLSYPYFVSNASILSKLHYIMGQISQFSRKHRCSHARIS